MQEVIYRVIKYIRRIVLSFNIIFVFAPLSLMSGELCRVYAVGSNDTLSVRNGPGIKYRKIYELPSDATNIYVKTCKKTSHSSRWCRIEYSDPKKARKVSGWVNYRYLFPMSSDPQIKKSKNLHKAKALARKVIRRIAAGEPCQLNDVLNKKFGLVVFIVPSGLHPRIYLIDDICKLDSEKITGGVFMLTDPAMRGKSDTIPKLVTGMLPHYDYDVNEGTWMLGRERADENTCYMSTPGHDMDARWILLDSAFIDMLIESGWSRENLALTDRLKMLMRKGYKVVCPSSGLVFFVMMIDGKWYLGAFDFASMNFM